MALMIDQVAVAPPADMAQANAGRQPEVPHVLEARLARGADVAVDVAPGQAGVRQRQLERLPPQRTRRNAQMAALGRHPQTGDAELGGPRAHRLPTTTCLSSWKARMPAAPRSRPYPLCL